MRQLLRDILSSLLVEQKLNLLLLFCLAFRPAFSFSFGSTFLGHLLAACSGHVDQALCFHLCFIIAAHCYLFGFEFRQGCRALCVSRFYDLQRMFCSDCHWSLTFSSCHFPVQFTIRFLFLPSQFFIYGFAQLLVNVLAANVVKRVVVLLNSLSILIVVGIWPGSSLHMRCPLSK